MLVFLDCFRLPGVCPLVQMNLAWSLEPRSFPRMREKTARADATHAPAASLMSAMMGVAGTVLET